MIEDFNINTFRQRVKDYFANEEPYPTLQGIGA